MDSPAPDVRARASRRRVAGDRRGAGAVRGRRRGDVSGYRDQRRAWPFRRWRRVARRRRSSAQAREAELRGRGRGAGRARRPLPRLPGWRARSASTRRERDRDDRRTPPPRQAARRDHVRSGRRLRPSRSHRDQPADDRGDRVRRGSAFAAGAVGCAASGVEAVLHRLERGEVGRLPGGAEEARRHAWTASSGRRCRGRTGRSPRSSTPARCGRRCGARSRATRRRWRFTQARGAVEEHQRSLWGTQEFYRVFSTRQRRPARGKRICSRDCDEHRYRISRRCGTRAPLAMTPASSATSVTAGRSIARAPGGAAGRAGHPRRVAGRGPRGARRRAALPAPAPMPAAARDATELLFDHSLFNGHPRFFGYITSSPAPIGMLGDFSRRR